MEYRVVHIRGGDEMAGRLDQRTVLAEGLTEAGKQRHVLTGRPNGPIVDQEQRFGVGLDKGEEKTRQGHLGARIGGIRYLHDVRRLRTNVRPNPARLLQRNVTLTAP